MKPVIGITPALKDEEQSHGTFCLYYINEAYPAAVEAAGGIPLLLPPQDNVEDLLNVVDGLLFTGGPDVDPAIYGDTEVHPETYGISAKRDQFEIDLLRAATAANVPVLGICRGIQVMNVAMGGSLIQHLDRDSDDAIAHRQHEIGLAADTVGHSATISHPAVQAIFGGPRVSVNSFHHQAVKDIAPGLEIAGESEDGVVEALVRPGQSYFVGLQWHPELMFRAHPEQLRPFASLVEAAAARRLAGARA